MNIDTLSYRSLNMLWTITKKKKGIVVAPTNFFSLDLTEFYFSLNFWPRGWQKI